MVSQQKWPKRLNHWEHFDNYSILVDTEKIKPMQKVWKYKNGYNPWTMQYILNIFSRTDWYRQDLANGLKQKFDFIGPRLSRDKKIVW